MPSIVPAGMTANAREETVWRKAISHCNQRKNTKEEARCGPCFFEVVIPIAEHVYSLCVFVSRHARNLSRSLAQKIARQLPWTQPRCR